MKPGSPGFTPVTLKQCEKPVICVLCRVTVTLVREGRTQGKLSEEKGLIEAVKIIPQLLKKIRYTGPLSQNLR